MSEPRHTVGDGQRPIAYCGRGSRRLAATSIRPVAPTFLSAGAGDFPVASSFAPGKTVWKIDRCGFFFQGPTKNHGHQEHGTGKFREPANKNVCATPRRNVDIPVGGCWRLSSRQFLWAENRAGYRPTWEHGIGKSRTPADQQVGATTPVAKSR